MRRTRLTARKKKKRKKEKLIQPQNTQPLRTQPDYGGGNMMQDRIDDAFAKGILSSENGCKRNRLTNRKK